MKLTLLLAIVAAPAALVAQDGFTGHALLKRCESFVKAVDGESLVRAEWFEAGVCAGVIRAASFVAEATQAPSICIPDMNNAQEQVQAVVSYLSEHPEELDSPDLPLVVDALADAFPCQ